MNSRRPHPLFCFGRFDYAHHAGVRVSHLHTKTLLAEKNSTTGGVGERIREFVEGEGITTVVLGSRGLGSIKRCAEGGPGGRCKIYSPAGSYTKQPALTLTASPRRAGL